MRKFYFVMIGVLLLFFVLPAKAQVQRLNNGEIDKQVAQLFTYLLSLSADSVFFNRTIDSIKQSPLAAGNDKMQWYVDMYRVVMPSYIFRRDGQADSSARSLLAKDPYFSQSPYPDVQVSWWYHLGICFYYQKNYERAFYYTIQANDQAERMGYDRIPFIRHFWDNLFHLSYQVGDYPAALHYLELLIEKVAGKNEDDRLPYILGNLGETYLKLHNLPKAKKAFLQSIAIARQHNDVVWEGISSGNYGYALQLEGRYTEALPYFYYDIQVNKDTLPDNTAITYVFLANTLLQLDSTVKAAYYLQKAPLLGPKWQLSSFAQHYYETMALYYQKTGDYRKAFLYQDSLLRYNNAMKRKNDLALFKAMTLTFKENRRLEEARLNVMEARQLQYTRNAIIAFLLLLFAVVIAQFYRHGQRQRQRFIGLQQQTKEKLLLAQEKLTQYVNAIKEKNNLIEAFELRLTESIAGQPQTDIVPVQQTFSDFTLLTEDDWQEFKKLFSVAHPDFFFSFYSRYPDLSQGELRLLALSKLALSSREMAGMLGISIESLRKSRYRLRKKYPGLLQEEGDKNDEQAKEGLNENEIG